MSTLENLSLSDTVNAAAKDGYNFHHLNKEVIPYQEVSENMKDFLSLELSRRKPSFIVTPNVEYIYKLLRDDQPFSLVLEGGSGIGKSTTLMVVSHLARLSGCVVLPVEARSFMIPSEPISLLLHAFLRTWKLANHDLLTKLNLFKLVEDCLKQDCSLKLFFDIVQALLELTVVPVVIIVDQFNLFLTECDATDVDLDNRKLFASKFSRVNTLRVARGCILFAETASFDSTPYLRGGNTAIAFPLRPFDKTLFRKLTSLLVESGELPSDVLGSNFEEFYAHCGGLPREADSFRRADGRGGEKLQVDFQKWLQANLSSRCDFYTDRLRRLLSSSKAPDMQRESSELALSFLFSESLSFVPRSWKNSGLVIMEESHCRLACRAAELALVMHFTPEKVRQSIEILGSDPCISWRVLELCFIYLFRRSVLGGREIKLPHTDLSGLNPGVLHAQVPRVKSLPGTLENDSVMPGTFAVYPRGQALVDFLIYTVDKQVIFVQISESSYADHRLKLTEMKQLDELAKIVKEYDAQMTKHFLFVTTSSTLMRESPETRSKHFSGNVKLISNADGSTDRLLQGIMPASSSFTSLRFMF